MKDLVDYEIEDLENSINFQEEKEEKAEAWSINDLEGADWALRKIAALEEKNKNVEYLANRELDRINNWLDKETQNNNQIIEFLKAKLKDYLFYLKSKDKKARISVPHGTVNTRKVPSKFIYDDKTALNSLKNLGMSDYINVKETLNKAALRKALKAANGKAVNENGEIVEGVEASDPSEIVTFKEEL